MARDDTHSYAEVKSFRENQNRVYTAEPQRRGGRGNGAKHLKVGSMSVVEEKRTEINHLAALMF